MGQCVASVATDEGHLAIVEHTSFHICDISSTPATLVVSNCGAREGGGGGQPSRSR